MKALKARYIRVSSQQQNEARQLALKHPDEKVYTDVISGSIPFNQRPQGKLLIDAVEAGKINYITFHDISRAGRNTIDVLQTLQYFQDKDVTIKVENLGLESKLPNGKSNPLFKLLTTILSEVNSMERDSLLERQAEGLKIYKAKNEANRKLGIIQKRNKPSASDKEILLKYKGVVKELKSGKNSLRKVATLCDTSLGTVQKVKAAMDRELANEKGN